MQKQILVLLCSTRERKTYFSCTTALHTATAVTHTHSENIFLAKRIIQSNCSDTRKQMVYKHSRKRKMDAITVIVLSSDTVTDRTITDWTILTFEIKIMIIITEIDWTQSTHARKTFSSLSWRTRDAREQNRDYRLARNTKIFFLQNELHKATALIHENNWYTNTGFHGSRKQKMDAIGVIVLSCYTLTDWTITD